MKNIIEITQVDVIRDSFTDELIAKFGDNYYYQDSKYDPMFKNIEDDWRVIDKETYEFFLSKKTTYQRLAIEVQQDYK